MEDHHVTIKVFGKTDVGKVRDHNEDNFRIVHDISENEWFFNDKVTPIGEKGAVLVVADGMGGATAGEIASEIAVNTVVEGFKELKKIPESNEKIIKFLEGLVLKGNQNIIKHASKESESTGMGTTIVLLWLIKNKAFLIWVGDSRCYIKRNEGSLQLVSQDHSMVWQMVLDGELTPEEARVHPHSNIILQSLGGGEVIPKPQTHMMELEKGDRVLLCSDGLNGPLSDEEIGTIFNNKDETPTSLCSQLVDAANDAGGTDNITVAVLEVVEIPKTIADQVSDTTFRSVSASNSGKNTKKSNSKMLFFVFFLLILSVSIGAWFYLNPIESNQNEIDNINNSNTSSLILNTKKGDSEKELKKDQPIKEEIKKLQGQQPDINSAANKKTEFDQKVKLLNKNVEKYLISIDTLIAKLDTIQKFNGEKYIIDSTEAIKIKEQISEGKKQVNSAHLSVPKFENNDTHKSLDSLNTLIEKADSSYSKIKNIYDDFTTKSVIKLKGVGEVSEIKDQ